MTGYNRLKKSLAGIGPDGPYRETAWINPRRDEEQAE